MCRVVRSRVEASTTARTHASPRRRGRRRERREPRLRDRRAVRVGEEANAHARLFVARQPRERARGDLEARRIVLLEKRGEAPEIGDRSVLREEPRDVVEGRVEGPARGLDDGHVAGRARDEDLEDRERALPVGVAHACGLMLGEERLRETRIHGRGEVR